MAQFPLIDGVNYLFDRYDFLGLDPTASKDDIRRAIRTMAEPLTNQALKPALHDTDLLRRTLDSCARVLLNDKTRPFYDRCHHRFMADMGALMTSTPQPFRALSLPFVDIDALLTQKPDLAFPTKLTPDIATAAGYAPADEATARARYAKSPHTPSVRQELMDILGRKRDALSQQGAVCWEGVAYAQEAEKYTRLKDPAQLVDVATGMAQHVMDKAVIFLNARKEAMACGIAHPPALIAKDQDLTAPPRPRTMTAVEEKTIMTAMTTAWQARTTPFLALAAQEQDCLLALSAVKAKSPLSAPKVSRIGKLRGPACL